MSETPVNSQPHVPFWQPIIFAALAGGMAWGIRGQYGHETGAMMAGLLVGLTLVFLFCRNTPSISVARAVAWMTVAIGIGGNMTYGQTLGLSHDPELVGNASAYQWGMLGCAIKGAVWIGFGAVFLGMGLGGVKYKTKDLIVLMLCCVGAYYLGVRILNYPFNPAEKQLPFLYFSDDWRWEPNGDLRPRRESWGGLWFALITVIIYVSHWRKDKLARNLACFGILGGAIGFPLGQSIQAYNAWHQGFLADTSLVNYFASTEWWTKINWWNMMETTFGAVMGAMVGLGLWINRKKINPLPPEESDTLNPVWEIIALAIHVPMVAAVDFKSIQQVDVLYDVGLVMAIIPIIAIAGGRLWPYLVVFPILLMPIAGKTVRQLVIREDPMPPYFGFEISANVGWVVYLYIPLALSLILAAWFASDSKSIEKGRSLAKVGLLFSVWIIFYLNWAFFHFPWPFLVDRLPWSEWPIKLNEWTSRTPNGIIFFICAVGLTLLAITNGFWLLRESKVKRAIANVDVPHLLEDES
jgi:hypothetical protein